MYQLNVACSEPCRKARRRYRALRALDLKALRALCLRIASRCLLQTTVALVLLAGIMQEATASQETVILLHGIARTGRSMSSTKKFLDKAGYQTITVNYPSTKNNLSDIATGLHGNALSDDFWKNAGKVHFVTHSMGGLVAREYLEKYKAEIPRRKLGYVVMLAPPNGGSEVADALQNLKPYKWFYGPAGQEITTAAQRNVVAQPYYELGIIAGTKKWPYFVARFIIPAESDGRVSVEKTKLQGMKDHIVVSATHSFIMNKKNVHRQILCFLQHGKFERM